MKKPGPPTKRALAPLVPLNTLRKRAQRHVRRGDLLPKATALTKLRQLAREVGEFPRAPLIANRDLILYASIRHHFGKVSRALAVIGCLGTKWSVGRVIKEVRLAHRRGIRVTAPALRVAGLGRLLSAAKAYVGGLQRARVLAGVPHPKTRRRKHPEPWDAERVIEEIVRRERDGESLAYSQVPRPLQAAGQRLFGSWREAVAGAGFDYARVRLVRERYGADEILNELRRMARRQPQLGRTQLQRTALAGAAATSYGSLDAALRKAGLDRWPRRTTESLPGAAETVRLLRRRARAGAPMNSRAVLLGDKRLYGAALKHFSAWTLALSAARLPEARSYERWSKATIRAALADRVRRGRSLRGGAVQREHSGLYQAACRHFGSYAAVAREFVA